MFRILLKKSSKIIAPSQSNNELQEKKIPSVANPVANPSKFKPSFPNISQKSSKITTPAQSNSDIQETKISVVANPNKFDPTAQSASKITTPAKKIVQKPRINNSQEKINEPAIPNKLKPNVSNIAQNTSKITEPTENLKKFKPTVLKEINIDQNSHDEKIAEKPQSNITQPKSKKLSKRVSFQMEKDINGAESKNVQDEPTKKNQSHFDKSAKIKEKNNSTLTKPDIIHSISPEPEAFYKSPINLKDESKNQLNDPEKRVLSSGRIVSIKKTTTDKDIEIIFESASRRTLFVSNLPFKVSEKHIPIIFDGFQIVSSKIQLNKFGKSKGSCYVEFTSPKELERVLFEMQGIEVDDRALKLQRIVE